VPIYPTPTRAEASRFLSHATLGYTLADIEAVRQQGYEVWIDRQFAAWTQTGHWDWLLSKRAEQTDYVNNLSSELQEMATVSAWRRIVEGRDLLRQKTVLALSEIVVASVSSDMAPFQEWGAANHLDLLEKHAFGNYRNLLIDVSKSLLMGYYLTYRGSAAAGTLSGGVNKPDENYARELMQLFTIGLNKLQVDGQQIMIGNVPVPTYTQDDVATVARVFTGWETTESAASRYAHWRAPMKNITARFDSGAKTFSVLPDGTRLMPDIPAGLSADENLSRVIDGLMAHQNIGPFICRNLIQRMVSSNPSAAYLGRVSAVFNNNGQGVKGDMRAVIRAILMDTELFDANNQRVGGLQTETFGKLREPMVRIMQWAKAFNARSSSGSWLIGNSTQTQKFGQRPMRSASVFNFFRPGYVPPAGSGIAGLTVGNDPMVSPEFQITNEVSNLEYLTQLREIVGTGISAYRSSLNVGVTDVKPDYSAWLPKAGDSNALVAELNLLLAAGQLSSETAQTIAQAINSIPFATQEGRLNRVKAAVFLVMSSPDYIAQK
jgi:uncharacterized protein (DUF1800 family)